MLCVFAVQDTDTTTEDGAMQALPAVAVSRQRIIVADGWVCARLPQVTMGSVLPCREPAPYAQAMAVELVQLARALIIQVRATASLHSLSLCTVDPRHCLPIGGV